VLYLISVYQDCFNDAWNSTPIVEVIFRVTSERSRSSEALPNLRDKGLGAIMAGNSRIVLPGLLADVARWNHTFLSQTSKILNRKKGIIQIFRIL
jgi:hypothetical protein